jgi:hypothetical protein
MARECCSRAKSGGRRRPRGTVDVPRMFPLGSPDASSGTSPCGVSGCCCHGATRAGLGGAGSRNVRHRLQSRASRRARTVSAPAWKPGRRLRPGRDGRRPRTVPGRSGQARPCRRALADDLRTAVPGRRLETVRLLRRTRQQSRRAPRCRFDGDESIVRAIGEVPCSWAPPDDPRCDARVGVAP